MPQEGFLRKLSGRSARKADAYVASVNASEDERTVIDEDQPFQYFSKLNIAVSDPRVRGIMYCPVHVPCGCTISGDCRSLECRKTGL